MVIVRFNRHQIINQKNGLVVKLAKGLVFAEIAEEQVSTVTLRTVSAMSADL